MAAEKNSRMTTEMSRSFSTTHDGSMTTVHAHHSHSRSHSHSQNQNIAYHYPDPPHPHHQPHHTHHRSYHQPIPPVPLPYASHASPIRSNSIPPNHPGFVYDRRTGAHPVHPIQLPAGETHVIVPPGKPVDVIKGVWVVGVLRIPVRRARRMAKEPLLKSLLGSITFSGNGNGGQHGGE
jgi:hypothetical protein